MSITSFAMPVTFPYSGRYDKRRSLANTGDFFYYNEGKMHILRTNFNGNPNVGLFGFATEEYCLIGKEVKKKDIKEIEKVLKVPCHRISLCGTSLIGAFAAGNSNILLLPEIVFEEELKVLDNLKIKYQVIKTHLTAFGNNILCNDNGCLVNPEFSAVQKKQIRTALNVPLKPGTIAGLDIVGSLGISNKNACIVHRNASDEEIEKVSDLLELEVHTGTANFGNPFVKSAIIANSNGFVIGGQSTGVEVNNVDDMLGFLGKD
ncbi:translation initiation factor IF-6 [Nanoarchaeota archaeon]